MEEAHSRTAAAAKLLVVSSSPSSSTSFVPAEKIITSSTTAARKYAFGKDFTAGFVAAIVAKTVMAPIERVKLILQLQSAHETYSAERRYRGVLDCLVRLPREQGFLSFWRGNWVNIWRSCAQESLGFAFKDTFRPIFLKNVRPNDQLQLLGGNLAAAGLSGVLTFFFIYPLDFTRTRLAIDMGRGTKREFRGFFHCVSSITQSDGLLGLYRGFSASVQYILIYRGAYYGLFDWSRPFIAGGDDAPLGFASAFLLGQVTTLAAGTLSYPLDTVRRRLMMQAGRSVAVYSSSLDCVRKIAQIEGYSAFFHGYAANALRGTGAALVLALYNELGKYW